MDQQAKACACGAARYKRYSKCQACYNAYMRDYMAKHRNTDKMRDKRLKHTYGISLDKYNQMLADQGGRCAICDSEEPGANANFEVDHDHSCCDGKRSCGECVRGLLCSNCNTGIARFKDDPSLMIKAMTYLRERKL